MNNIFINRLNSEKDKNKELISWSNKTLTYNDILKAYNSVNIKNVKKGDVVALIGDYEPQSIAYLLKLIDQGCVVVPLTMDTEKQHDYFFESAQIDWIIKNDKLEKYSFKKNTKHNLLSKLIDLGNPGLVLFSSGTTGKPKAILHDLVPFFKRYTDANKSITTISFLLFDHIGGLNTFFYSFFAGAKIVFPQERTPNYIWKLIEKEKVELLPTSPSFLRLSKTSVNFSELSLDNLKLVTYGTELMDSELLNWYVQTFDKVDFRQTYGLSELGILKIKSESKDSLFITIGGGTKFKIKNNTLRIKAEYPMLGYLNSPSPFDEDGFYDTKDLVEKKDDYFKIIGRESELVNIGGQKINPIDLETFLLSDDRVADASVFGIPNKILGNSLQLNIEFIEGMEMDKKTINKIILEKFPNIYRPSVVNVVSKSKYNHRYKKMRKEG